jgi:Zn-dependent protease
MFQIGGIRFFRTELRDLAFAWVALALAFTFFLEGPFVPRLVAGVISGPELARIFTISLVTVGTGFLLHELAHKVVAIRVGQIAAFKADYAMLGFAVAAGLAGFLFAAPGAVYHRGTITKRENGLISVAGPVTNLLLAAIFFVPFVLGPGFLGSVGQMGVIVNLGLAAFNMIPFGPLDGRSVRDWSETVFAVVLGTAILCGLVFLTIFGL